MFDARSAHTLRAQDDTMATRLSQLPKGYVVPLCQPLTRRVMMAGVPFEGWAGLFLLGTQLFNFRAYALLILVPLIWWGLRELYRVDEHAISAWLDHVRAVLHGTTRMEV